MKMDTLMSGGEMIWQDVLALRPMESDLWAIKIKRKFMTSIMRRPEQINAKLMRSSKPDMQ